MNVARTVYFILYHVRYVDGIRLVELLLTVDDGDIAVCQVCNNLGQCHCDAGYAPPYCDRPGNGGSEHSGPVMILHGRLSSFLCH